MEGTETSPRMNTATTSKMSSSYKITTPSTAEMDDMFNETKQNARETELINFTKCVAGKPDLLNALCEIEAIDGGSIDECCKRVGREKCIQIMRDAFALLVSGKMKVNGKENNWSNGCFGSCWFDMDAEKYGVDYIRGAFYSKKTYAGEWNTDKHYRIQITIEKAK
jgi:hypothetical protein